MVKRLIYITALLMMIGCTKALEEAFNISKVEFTVGKVVDSGMPENQNSYQDDFLTGVFVYETSSIPVSGYLGTPIVKNMQFRNSGGVLDGDKLYLDKQKGYNIYSYAPFTGDNKINGESIEFSHGTDVIYASARYSIKNQENVINKIQLDYEHLTSMVKFIFEDNRDISLKQLYDFGGMSFKINGFSRKYYLDVFTGKLTRGPTDPLVAITEENSAFCFAPKTGGTELNLELIIPAAGSSSLPPVIINEKFLYDFRPGHSYEITINIKTSEMYFSSHIVSWEYKEVEDLEIETK
jgi:hypothetical protein